jgi:hypothetical protein
VFEIGRMLTHVEGTFLEFCPAPARRAGVIEVIDNPCAGRYEGRLGAPPRRIGGLPASEIKGDDGLR